MSDPLAAARRVREVLADDGTWLVVEPYAGDTVADNLNPVGRVFYGGSHRSTAAGLLDGGAALGNQCRRRDGGRACLRWRDSPRPRRAAEREFNRLFECARSAAGARAANFPRPADPPPGRRRQQLGTDVHVGPASASAPP